MFAAGVQLGVVVTDGVDVVVCKLGTLVVEAFRVGEHLLERRGMDFVTDRLVVNRIPDSSVLDLVDAVDAIVDVEACRGRHEGFVNGIADAMGIEVRAGHGVGFFVDEAVTMAINGRVDAQGEDVLVVSGKDARVDNGAPGDGDAWVNGLGVEDAGGADFVDELAGLIEHKGHDIFVVRDSDNGLDDEFAVAYYSSTTGVVVGVLPTYARILLMNAHDVFHWQGFAMFIVQDCVQIVDGAEAVTTELEIISRNASAHIAEVEGCFSVEWGPRISVWNVHVRK